MRYQFIEITLSKPYSVCTFYNKQINTKKYEWKFGSVQILIAMQCRYTISPLPCIDVYNMDMEAQYCVPFLIVQQNNAKQANRPQQLATNFVPQNSSGSSPQSLVWHTHILEGHSSHLAHPSRPLLLSWGILTLLYTV